jgi:DNA-directed RNA polymerase subunit RPC12/RpoP
MSQTRGTVDSTACPHCKKPNDFSDVPMGLLEKGTLIECDHCKRKSLVARVQPVTMLWLKAV